jgi:hypothetical protein
MRHSELTISLLGLAITLLAWDVLGPRIGYEIKFALLGGPSTRRLGVFPPVIITQHPAAGHTLAMFTEKIKRLRDVIE